MSSRLANLRITPNDSFRAGRRFRGRRLDVGGLQEEERVERSGGE